MKTWKTCTALCISALLALMPYSLLNGCGGAWDEEDLKYSFFSPTLIPGLNNYSPFFFDTSSEFFDNTPPSDLDENIPDWQRFFGKKVPAEEILVAVYQTDTLALKRLQEYVVSKGKRGNIPKELPKLGKWLRKKKQAELVPYLLFARRCEPHVTVVDPWYGLSLDEETANRLIRQGRQLHDGTRSEFLRLRYAYQLVRLAHYSEQYALAVQLYGQLVEPNKAGSVIRYWAMSNAAGAMLRGAVDSKHNMMYLFSVVFDRAPSRNIAAYRAFVRWGGGRCPDCLKQAKTTREKTTIHFLEGLAWEADALAEMDTIYRLDPKSDQLEVLLSRELAKAERAVLPLRYEYQNNRWLSGYESSHPNPDQKELLVMAARGATEGKTRTPALWSFATAYVAHLMENDQMAEEYLQKALRQTRPGDPMHRQALLLQMIRKVEKAPEPTAELENYVLERLRQIDDQKLDHPSSKDARGYILMKMAEKYQAQEHAVLQDLCINLIRPDYTVRGLTDLDHIDRLIAFLEKPDKTPWETYLFEKYPFRKEQLIAQQGDVLLGLHRFAEAVEKYRQAGYNESPTFDADPFFIRINDCHDCDYADPQKQNHYNNMTFARRMAGLQQLATQEKNPGKAVEYHFLLGNGLYNITFFGNSWMVPAYPSDGLGYRYRSDGPTRESGDCTAARHHYEQAMKLARSREFAAKACFMAAKCEQNEYYLQKRYGLPPGPEQDELDEQTYEYFARLKKNYTNTRYYREIIKECSYFASYVGRKK